MAWVRTCIKGGRGLHETFDQAYFERQYRNYERQNPPGKLAFYRRLVERGAGEWCVRPRILDIGCAFGLFLSSLEDRWDCYGEDASAYAIQKAKERSPSVCFGIPLGGQHPFAGPFDAITAWDVLEHVAQLDELLRWISSNLAAGGTFAFVVPVYDGPTGPLIRLLDRDPTHVHKHGRDHWLALSGEIFELVEWWGIYRFLFPGGFYMHLVTRSLRRCTPALACLMRRR